MRTIYIIMRQIEETNHHEQMGFPTCATPDRQLAHRTAEEMNKVKDENNSYYVHPIILVE